MYLLEILIEHPSYSLDKPFTYFFDGSASVSIGVRVLVPFGAQTLVGYVVGVRKTDKTLKEINDENPYTVNPVGAVIDCKPLLNDELISLADHVSGKYLATKISVLQAMLPPSLKPKKSSLKAPKIAYLQILEFIKDDPSLTSKQRQWLFHIRDKGRLLKQDIPSPSVITALIGKGCVRLVSEEKRRIAVPETGPETDYRLTDEQEKAVVEIIKTDDQVYLLQGVTGSGKTEVYVELTKHYLRQNKNIIIIVPEIALTPMMVTYFNRHFPEDIAILHSDLTPAERYDEYRHIADGKARIVVGTRSAIFAPLRDIGLIAIDEEQVETYKQDMPPFYHARDIALWRAAYHRAKVVLGSATPSLESKARAIKHVYHPVYLTKRINQERLPAYEIVNLLTARNYHGDSSLISEKLFESMKKTIDNHEQVILLLNRRGYAPSVQCRTCGYIYKCPNCSIPLTYHSLDRRMKCHYCDHETGYPERCPQCGGKQFMHLGFGTERVEEEVRKYFPKARIARLDSDVGKTRTSVTRILAKFAKHEFDILIGTQMVAKGHDFPLVTLVGIILADYGLSIPGFRSAERTFQLITQAIGRAGRGQKPGTAVIQTYNPSHYAITCGADQDYESFVSEEMKIRRLTRNPPYWYLLKITLSGTGKDYVVDTIHALGRELEDALKDKAVIIGPSAPYIAKLGNRYRRNLLIKYRNYEDIIDGVRKALTPLFSKSMLKLYIDFEPNDI